MEGPPGSGCRRVHSHKAAQVRARALPQGIAGKDKSVKLTLVEKLKSCYGFVELLPYSYRLVVRPSHDEIGEIADSECPNFTVVTLKLLDVLKLNYSVLTLREHS